MCVRSPLSSAEIKNQWSYTSTSLVCRHCCKQAYIYFYGSVTKITVFRSIRISQGRHSAPFVNYLENRKIHRRTYCKHARTHARRKVGTAPLLLIISKIARFTGERIARTRARAHAHTHTHTHKYLMSTFVGTFLNPIIF